MAAKVMMSEEERREMMKQMDADVDEFILQKTTEKQERDANKTQEELDAENAEREKEMINHPAFTSEVDWSQPLSTAMEAMMALKYNVDDALDKAESYKEDGNSNFKHKKYTIAIDNYTEGIRARCAEKDMNATLYSNRAAAHYRIKNYGSSFKDCSTARKFKPDQMKAIVKGIECCMALEKYVLALKWCEEGLAIAPANDTLLQHRTQADKLKKLKDRDDRKKEVAERKEKVKRLKLLNSLKERNVRLEGVDWLTLKEDSVLEREEFRKLLSGGDDEMALDGAVSCVHLDEESGALFWPVLFMYPEYQQTDFLASASENSRLADHIGLMFESPPPWDVQRKYRPDTLQIYFEDQQTQILHLVSKESSIGEAIAHRRYTVKGGLPTFLLLVKGSEFEKDFLSKCTV